MIPSPEKGDHTLCQENMVRSVPSLDSPLHLFACFVINYASKLASYLMIRTFSLDLINGRIISLSYCIVRTCGLLIRTAVNRDQQLY